MYDYYYYFIVAGYANLSLIPPFLQPGFRHYYDGVNFASSGAGALVETFQGSVCIMCVRSFLYHDRKRK